MKTVARADEAGAVTPQRGSRRRRAVPGVPLPLLVPALVGLAFLLLPLLALLIRAPWRDLPDQLTSTAVWQALQLSLVSATAATAVSLVLGVP
ncbi:molybdate ABC transporter permease subunit, partial [Streptomyces sp. SID89]|nr:molybdate ABC transporter permease subunit [Streptomyces sp. SID89]